MESSDYQRIARAIHFLTEHRAQQPGLEQVAAHIGLSPFHFQRLFRRWAGVSPKRFLQFLTAEHAKQLLHRSQSLLETSLDVGLSGPGRLHDLLVSVDAVTPGEYKTRGAGIRIRYGLHESPYGRCLIGLTDRGICHLSFVDEECGNVAIEKLQREWTAAEVFAEPEGTGQVVEQIFTPQGSDRPLSLLLRGTNFQLKVWQALLNIPAGMLVTYQQLAAQIGQPTACRAVGNAVGCNPIAYLIPCHRVLRSNGAFGGYRWGTERKMALLGREMAQFEETSGRPKRVSSPNPTPGKGDPRNG